MRELQAVVVVVVALHTTAACSRDDAASARADASASTASSRIGSCDRVQSTSLCSEYSGAYLAQNEAVLSSSCGKLGGTFAQAACPNTSVLGSCTLSTTEVRKFYGSGAVAYEPSKAESECATSYKGKWSRFE